MTVIAWDGKVMAGDRMADYGGTPLLTRKVQRIKSKVGTEYLVGHSGNWGFCNAYVAWLVGKREDKPDVPQSEGFTVMLVDRAGKVFQVGHSLELLEVKPVMHFHAIGSGRGEALGAMAMGAGARKAVQVASRFSIGCGLGVDVVRFR